MTRSAEDRPDACSRPEYTTSRRWTQRVTIRQNRPVPSFVVEGIIGKRGGCSSVVEEIIVEREGCGSAVEGIIGKREGRGSLVEGIIVERVGCSFGHWSVLK
jgi:hypothetical protein